MQSSCRWERRWKRKGAGTRSGLVASEFSGEINWVELKVGEDNHSHLVDPKVQLKVLTARQIGVV